MASLIIHLFGCEIFIEEYQVLASLYLKAIAKQKWYATDLQGEHEPLPYPDKPNVPFHNHIPTMLSTGMKYFNYFPFLLRYKSYNTV